MLEVLQDRAKWSVTRGRAEELLAQLPDESVHAVVCDPPAWIDFMGKSWDASDEYEKFEAVQKQCLRVLKPGGHSLTWAIPRTSHWTAEAIERAGFEIRDRIHDLAAVDDALWNFVNSLTLEQWDGLARVIESQSSSILMHVFGQGFPKSLNVAKALDKAAGVKPIGEKPPSLGMATGPNSDQWNKLNRQLIMPPTTTEDAKRWEGWGTALKPAVEHWILARKPFKGSVPKNVVKHGTGALNIDGCRVKGSTEAEPEDEGAARGRWPAHLVLEHGLGCRIVGERTVKTGVAVLRNGGGGKIFHGHAERQGEHAAGYEGPQDDQTYGDGTDEVVPAWACVLGCPVRLLDEQSGALKSGTGAVKRATAKGHQGTDYGKESRPEGTPMLSYGDMGGASRFYYQAKPSVSEKNKGCEKLPVKTPEEMTGRKTGSAGLVMTHKDGSPKANAYAGTSGKARPNFHPTVKSVQLMRWLVRLVTVPGGIVLDPFAGSGSTGVAALLEGCRAILIDKDEDEKGQPLGYCEIARARCADASPKPEPEVF